MTLTARVVVAAGLAVWAVWVLCRYWQGAGRHEEAVDPPSRLKAWCPVERCDLVAGHPGSHYRWDSDGGTEWWTP